MVNTIDSLNNIIVRKKFGNYMGLKVLNYNGEEFMISTFYLVYIAGKLFNSLYIKPA